MVKHVMTIRVTPDSLVLLSLRVISSWASDTIWWHRSGLTLVQVLAGCLIARSHDPNRCWIIVCKVFTQPSIKKNLTINCLSIILFKSPWSQRVLPMSSVYPKYVFMCLNICRQNDDSCRWYPAKRALPAMLTHGREGLFGRIPSMLGLVH